MKIKILLILFIFTTNLNAENKYIYFNNSDIFFFNKNNVFYKLINKSELVNKKFNIKNHFKKKKYFKIKESEIKLDKGERFRLRDNSNSFIIVDNFKDNKKLKILNQNEIVTEFNFPLIDTKFQTLLLSKNKPIKKRNIFNQIKNYFLKDILMYSKYEDDYSKLKIKDLKIPIPEFDKNLILIETNLDIKEIFFKLEDNDKKHITYFDNRVSKDKNLQYFSVVEKKGYSHFDELKKQKNNNFFITEIQIIFNNFEKQDYFIKNFSLLKAQNIKNFDYFNLKNSKNSFHLESFIKENLKTNDHYNYSIISSTELNILTENKIEIFPETKEKNTDLLTKDKFENISFKNFLNKIIDEEIEYSILIERKNSKKFYFLLFSISPFLILSLIIFLLKHKRYESHKKLILCKTFFSILILFFIFKFIYLINYKSHVYSSLILFILLIFILIFYIFVKKYKKQVNSINI